MSAERSEPRHKAVRSDRRESLPTYESQAQHEVSKVPSKIRKASVVKSASRKSGEIEIIRKCGKEGAGKSGLASLAFALWVELSAGASMKKIHIYVLTALYSSLSLSATPKAKMESNVVESEYLSRLSRTGARTVQRNAQLSDRKSKST